MASTEPLVDNLIEDEADLERLRAKPTCFIIVGRPGVGKSTLASKFAESWKCVLIDDQEILNTHIQNQTKEGEELLEILSEGKTIPEDLLLTLIIDKLNTSQVEHYGYVLSCLPFMSEGSLTVDEQIKLIKNLRLAPDIIINIKCADKDLAQRLAGVKQHPETGEFYRREQWMEKKKVNKREVKEDEDEAEEDEEEFEEPEDDPLADIRDQMVWTPDYLIKNITNRIDTFKSTMLRPLEDYIADHDPLFLFELDGNSSTEELLWSVISRLESLALKRVSVPVRLNKQDEVELPDEIDTDELMRIMCCSRTVVPGFRWRRSLWGRTCPVSLKEGKFHQGKSEYSVGFQDKIYILSSQEACKKFFVNPRQYLLPPMPRLPCKISVLGPAQSGKTTLCKLLAEKFNTRMLDMQELLPVALAKLEQEKLEKIKEDTIEFTIEKIKMEIVIDDVQNPVTEDHPEVKEAVFAALEAALPLNIPLHEVYKEVMETSMKQSGDTTTESSFSWVLDNFPNCCMQLEVLQEVEILPDVIIFLKDTDGNHVLKRLYEKNKETVDRAVKKRLQREIVFYGSDGQGLGYPDGPEMNAYKLQMSECEAEWIRMEPGLSMDHCVLEIGTKTPEELLQDVLHQMEKPFKYVPWELSGADLQEEEEDNDALQALEKAESGSIDSDAADYDNDADDDPTAKRVLGDSYKYCPVALRELDVLWPCTDEVAAKYREKIYYFSNLEARENFIQRPQKFVAKTEPLKPPALRVFILGARGAGKTTNGKWIAQQLDIFYVQLREVFQELVLAKTMTPVVRADEVEPPEEPPEGLEALLKEAKARGEDVGDVVLPPHEPEVPLTDEEESIRSYLIGGAALPHEILDKVLVPFWKKEPYKTTGFLLEGFPTNVDEVHYMIQRQIFPDMVIVMELGTKEVVHRLLPTRLQSWRERHARREAQQRLLIDLRRRIRESDMVRRRAEILAELAYNARDPDDDEDEENNPEETLEEEVENLLLEEFPSEEEDNFLDEDEPEEAAVERMEAEIEERFDSDDNNLINLTELITEQNIPKVSIDATRQQRVVRYQLLQTIYPLLRNRESLFQQCQSISYSLAWKLLRGCYKFHSAFGCYDPVLYKEGERIMPLQGPDTTYPILFHQYIYFFASKDSCSLFKLNPLKYLRQPKPIPCHPIRLVVVGPPKSGKTTVAQMFAQKYGMVRLSIGSVMRMVLNMRENSELVERMRQHLCQGLVVPDELAIMCLEVVVMSLICSTRGFVLDGFPMTEKQAELMSARSIIPMVAVELQLDTAEVLRRGLIDKLKLIKPYPMHNSSVIMHIRNSCYKQEVVHVRCHFQRQYQNWITLDGLKSKWWIWNSIVEEVHISIRYIQNYTERIRNGKAACIHRLCITPKELHEKLGEFRQYCPVCLALNHHLVDCSDAVSLIHTAEYQERYYRMCGAKHLETFLSTPDQFVVPGCPYTLPETRYLPRMLNEIQLRIKFPQKPEMMGFCPVTYLDGKQRYEALVRGKQEYAVDYRGRIYFFETKEKQDKFMSLPEKYWNMTLPCKVPPICEQIPLTSLPTLGYLEQGVAQPVIKAMTAVGCLKPKYPYLSVHRSALLYLAYYLKAFNHKSAEYIRQKYKKKLALFEENCMLIPYLNSAMAGDFKPSRDRPVEFEFKLRRFLALADLPPTDSVV